MPGGPKFGPNDPKIVRRLEVTFRSGFRSRNGELNDSGVSGLAGDNSPVRVARPKLASYSDSSYPKPDSTLFWDPRLIYGQFCGTHG